MKLSLKEPVADEIGSLASLSGPFELEGFSLAGVAASAGGPGAPDEFAGTDLSLLGKSSICERSLERLKKMTKQRRAELKLSGDLANGDSGLVDGADSADAFEI